jgi:hypothetical protein
MPLFLLHHNLMLRFVGCVDSPLFALQECLATLASRKHCSCGLVHVVSALPCSQEDSISPSYIRMSCTSTAALPLPGLM